MSTAEALLTAAPASVQRVETSEALAAIQRPDCSAAVWHRAPVPGLAPWLEGLDPATLPRARFVMRPEKVRQAMTDILDGAALPEDAHRAALIDDVTALADRFATLMEAPYLRVRLDVITTNACRRFHIDVVTARLVCTYMGTGTQYGLSADGAEPEHIHTVPTGAPILLRGTLWPVTPKSGLLHRSPPIEGTGETRLVLVLDPIFDLDDALDETMLH
ncbi:MAG: DUF1826 domain-containing protein [Pseudomonadota bacterium]